MSKHAPPYPNAATDPFNQLPGMNRPTKTMTAETDLLPLPEPVAVRYPDSGLRDDEHALRLWAAHGYDTGGEPLFSAEQLREATAPLQAEIEALRAYVNAMREALEEIRRRTSMNLAMHPNPFELTAKLGDIHQIADAALSKENSND